MPKKKHSEPHSTQKEHQPIRKYYIWPEVIELPKLDNIPDIPYEPEPDYEPPWF